MKSSTLILLALSAVALARGQDQSPAPAAPPAASGRAAIVVPALKGIRLAPGSSTPGPVSAGVDLSAFPALERSSLGEKLGARVGQPFRITDLDAIIREIKAAYSALGQPFVEVIVPPQDITNGGLTLVIVEGRIGKVKVTGAKWFSEASYLADLHLTPGQPINKRRLDADLDWIQRGGYRQATVQATPGNGVGTTDLVLNVQERRPWSFNLGYADSGTSTTDDERISAGVTWGDAFGRGQELSYQLVTSPDLRTSVAHSGSYVVPIDRWHHIFRADAAWSTIRADIPTPFDSKGYSWQIGLNYEIPLPEWKLDLAGVVTHSFTAGFDLKETNNNIEFSSVPVTDNTTRVVQFRVGYDASLTDRLGGTSLRMTGVFSPGGLTANNDDAAFAGSRSGAKARYAYLNLSLQRQTKLPHDFGHSVSLTGQLSTENLLGSEQLGLGGANSVRGYDEGLAYGDQGILLRNEITLPGFSALGKIKGGSLRDSVRLLAFWDYGVARSKHLLAGEDPNLILSSVGAGVRYQLGEHFSARFDYGWQQKDIGFPTREERGRGHVSATMTW
jgi:hemolysin activation/secretion protein